MPVYSRRRGLTDFYYDHPSYCGTTRQSITNRCRRHKATVRLPGNHSTATHSVAGTGLPCHNTMPPFSTIEKRHPSDSPAKKKNLCEEGREGHKGKGDANKPAVLIRVGAGFPSFLPRGGVLPP
ncbi:hypothetical protein IAQ61_005111 [Plenodomus lingam]|uniref:uncharacterized protein n=1 Tax=Leptosphaeria maculans TaxID=5022 RepID=UPI00332E2CEE|nr:hypothetical protein IAQ61_005111 [Plenodomus lingam]